MTHIHQNNPYFIAAKIQTMWTEKSRQILRQNSKMIFSCDTLHSFFAIAVLAIHSPPRFVIVIIIRHRHLHVLQVEVQDDARNV